MEAKTRPSSKRDKEGNVIYKKFNCLTEKGLKYGRNDVSTHNTKETQPMYYENTFMALYEEIETIDF